MIVSKRNRRLPVLAIFMSTFLLALVGLVLRPFVLTELAIRKVLRNPAVALSLSEEIRIYRYVVGEPWNRLPGVLISNDRQAKLVEAGVKRQAEVGPGGGTLLLAMGEMWADNRGFLTLPLAVNEAILRGDADAAEMLMSAGGGSKGKIDSYIDVDFVMMSSKDPQLILASCIVLEKKTLYKHRRACFEMLKRDDLPTSCKSFLLGRIAVSNQGAKWFAGEKKLLQFLRSFDDTKVNAAIQEINDQLKTAPQAKAIE